ncbi:bifunctional phosphopantothenoylcysteine decarboxylase/phosphopantothenate--cysteine ligase CoaBC [Methylocaldum sp.]|uniref:bifunctional phosphopantothenoylcysteine decarboxylase/phosphopantothenate--cysteine ligase CoaBC n=1 Tax=Methylocaldum sp. TaxID=1969727 RepID=UPI002D6C1BA4|nr:bifunctional phosphopantothenoylcysteine decarboxylase/phosphopantothenate--cysteine ligase CoaBC [Methylocaldum sp.]HYE35091.1 bifunctional phosphopantothenoylcysteine decarboxylase/phosphopantothenate--cysteine ligase CoaBC [Methylocaldum sp.]
MTNLTGKHIVLGITGGIAAYKAAELTRLLRNAGASVRVAMTHAATAFVSPLTFQALSANPVHTELLDTGEESAMGHISLARWADLVLIAPATADFIAKLRAGLGDDLLSTLCLATRAPIAVAPAMNQAMWDNPATQENVRCLRDRGMRILGPEEGGQACGEVGMGRLLEPQQICDELGSFFDNGVLAGLSVLISAGPTREAIDPVRYISNRSSGKMGYALAEAATQAGAKVSLVTGPTALNAPRVHDLSRVESAADMYRSIMDKVSSANIYIGAAAVADYCPAAPEKQKIKKNESEMVLTLKKTQDILSAVSASEKRPFTVGFAAETDQLEDHARQKLAAKSLDIVAANWVGREQGGFENDDNALFVCWNGGHAYLPLAPKKTIAEQLIRLIAERYHAQNPAKNPR